MKLAIFNNKGGVGKTTYLFHIANILADDGIRTLMVDCDSQCNLTAYCLEDSEIYKSWREDGNSIFRVIQPVSEGVGDIRKRKPVEIGTNLFLIPGDIDLNIYEDRLGETWPSAGVQSASIRLQIAIYRYIEFAAKKCDAQVVLIDLGPNLGALNRAVLGGCDYFITPLSPDLFSIKGTQNLGNKFVVWHDEWENNLRKWKRNDSGIPSTDLPNGAPVFLGYVMQQHNIRNTRSGMTRGWEIFGNEVDGAVTNNIVKKLLPLQQVEEKETYLLGKIPNLHSLIPYSLNAHKPVYKCASQDGLTGSHLTKARESKELYQGIVHEITSVLNKENT